jgi:hypothetical protein
MIHQTYGHVTPRMRAGAVSRLGELLAGTPPADAEANGYQSGTNRGEKGAEAGALEPREDRS